MVNREATRISFLGRIHYGMTALLRDRGMGYGEDTGERALTPKLQSQL